MPEDNPFAGYTQQERDSVGKQMKSLLDSGKLTVGQKRNVMKALQLNNQASQAAGPKGPGFDEKHPVGAAALDLAAPTVQPIPGISDWASKKSREAEEYSTYHARQAFGPESQGKGAISRGVHVLASQAGDAAAIPYAMLGASPADVTMAALPAVDPAALPVTEGYFASKGLGSLTGASGQGSTAAQAVMHPTPQSTRSALLDASMVIPGLHTSVEGKNVPTISDIRKGVGEAAREHGAAIGTKAARPTPEMQELAGDPTATGRAVAKAGIITSKKRAVSKIDAKIEEVKAKRNADASRLEASGYRANVESQFDQAIADALAKNPSAEAKNAIQKFADTMKYEVTQGPKGFQVDYGKPRNLKYMTPTEVNALIDKIDAYAYPEANVRANVEKAARAARFAISQELGKNIPGYVEQGRQMRSLIDAKESYKGQIAAEARDAGKKLHSVYQAGAGAIGLLAALKMMEHTMELGTRDIGAYAAAFALLKTGMSTPSRTLRAFLWNKVGDMIDPQNVTGQWPSNVPTPPPPGAPPVPGTAGQTVSPTGGAPAPAAPGGTGTVGGRTAYSGGGTPPGASAGGSTTTGATYVRPQPRKPSGKLTPEDESTPQSELKKAAEAAPKVEKPAGTPEAQRPVAAPAPSDTKMPYPNAKPYTPAELEAARKLRQEFGDVGGYVIANRLNLGQEATGHNIAAFLDAEKKAKAAAQATTAQTPAAEMTREQKVAAAKERKKAADAARMQEKRAMAKGEAKSAAQAALGKEGGAASLFEAISKDFTPEGHVMFMEKAEEILKGLSQENYKTYKSVTSGADAQTGLSPADKRAFVVQMIEASQDKK